MERFNNQELADMHFIYGFCNGNAAGAVREYRRRFPQRQVPRHEMFVNIHRRLCENGNFKRLRGQGRPQGDYNLEQVLNHFENDPQISIRAVSRVTRIPRTIVMN